jgi:hypothetical protein
LRSSESPLCGTWEAGTSTTASFAPTRYGEFSENVIPELTGFSFQASKLKVRVQAAVPLSSWSRLRDYIKANGTGDDRLSVGSLKGTALRQTDTELEKAKIP